MKVSVVIPAFNEEEAISEVVRDFRATGLVDEVVVVDNNSTDRTADLAKAAGAKVVKEVRQGYGWALRRGMAETHGDVVVLAEADNTFAPKDITKFLAYIDDVDMVLGTRLTHELLEKGAKMNWFLRWGNLFIAKLIQLRFWGRTRLTDVGCTFRAIRRPAMQRILPKFRVGGNHFSPEMIVVALKNGLRTVEIPVHYRIRVGQSKITSNKWKAFRLGLRMIRTVLLA